MSPTQAPPVAMPFVEIRGNVYFLRYSLFAQYYLDKLGVNVQDLMATLVPRLPDGSVDPNPPMVPGKLAGAMTLFAACTAQNFVDDRRTIRTPDEWAAIIPDEDWRGCIKAMGEALLKVPQATNPAPPAVTEPTGVQ